MEFDLNNEKTTNFWISEFVSIVRGNFLFSFCLLGLVCVQYMTKNHEMSSFFYQFKTRAYYIYFKKDVRAFRIIVLSEEHAFFFKFTGSHVGRATVSVIILSERSVCASATKWPLIFEYLNLAHLCAGTFFFVFFWLGLVCVQNMTQLSVD